MEETLYKKIDTFFIQFKKQTYKKGEILIHANENPSSIYYLKTGLVKEYAISDSGEEFIINIFKSGTFFPMSWAITMTPNRYYYEAVTVATLWRAPTQATLTFLKTNPDIAYDLLWRVYKGMEGILSRMTHLMSGNAYTRLITELLIAAKRFGKKQKDGETIVIEVSEKDLASQSGMTRETVSRTMKLLKNKNLVRFDKNTLLITSIQKLADELAIPL